MLSQRLPNIVFVLIDDLGRRDLSCFGSTFHETPSIDRLADEGMVFTDAYASCPVCSPTRASLMTGKSPARIGMTQAIGGYMSGRLCDVPYFSYLPYSELTAAEALAPAGYQCWHVGKWHLGDRHALPDRRGFEVNLGGCNWGLPKNGYFSPYGIPGFSDGVPGEYLTDRLTDEAIALIEQRDRDRPFFLNLWHYAVHKPIQAPPELVAKYEQKARSLGLDRQSAFADGERYPCHPRTNARVRRRLIQSDPEYAAMVENLDANVGRVLHALEREDCVNDTVVIFTSDNGGLSTSEAPVTSNLPLAEGKGWTYEGGVRVPQIVRFPGVTTPGSVCATPTTSCDWYPTLLSLAGLPLLPRQHADGVGITPLLRGRSMRRPPIFWHYPHYSNQGSRPACSIRDGDWKLIEHFEDGRRELFNLAKDEGERNDLVHSEPDRAKELYEKLVAWRDEVEALLPRVNPYWDEPHES